jgi:drug/metabolite transporter (DMT)-like permease
VKKKRFDQAYVLLTLAILFWSGNVVLGRAVHDQIPPVGLAFWRWTTAFLIVIGFAWPRLRREWTLVLRHWRIIVVLSALGVAAFNTLLYTGLHFTTAINAALMQSTMPVMIVAMSYLFFGETVSARQKAGIVVSLLGVLIIVLRGDYRLLSTLSLNPGDLWVLSAVVSYAGYSALLRKRPPLHGLSFLGVTFGIGALMLLPFYAWEGLAGKPMPLDQLTLLTILYVAVFPSILAYLCFNRGVALIGANRAGVFVYLMPVFGGILAIVFLGESFRLFHGVGIVLIASGIFLATRVD